MDDQVPPWYDGWSGGDGEAPAITTAGSFIPAGDNPGETVLCGLHQAEILRKGESRRTPPGFPKLGRGTVPKVCLRKDGPGPRWSHITPKDTGPDVGCLYQAPKEEQLQEQEAARLDCSPLTSELLGPGEEVIGDLDYEDVVEADQGPNPEIVEAVANIPQATNWVDVEMQESRSPPGFKPEVAKEGYDVNLVHPNPAEPTATSPVMAVENRILDTKTPGAG